MDWTKQINDSAGYIKSCTDLQPEVGLILGSGLGAYAESLEDTVYIPYSEIPGFPVSTVEGHAGRFAIGKKHGCTVIAMQGRFHYYEGYSQTELVLPVRVMKALGVKKLIVTNAAGGVNKSFPVGSLMLINDHINFSGSNPLFGPNLDDLGPRFPDMSDVYTAGLRAKIKKKADTAGIPLVEGVYMMFTGPNYETPAEVRLARTLGADAVGMSTVPEAIAARHCGLEVVGISCITNFAAGILDQPLNHAEVVETSNRVHNTFVQLLDLILQEVK